MQIEVVRRGGFAGIRRRGTIDTAELPPDVASAASAALQELQFDRPPSPPRHPESFQYEITIVDGDTHRTAILDEAEVPDDLRPVVEAAIARGTLG